MKLNFEYTYNEYKRYLLRLRKIKNIALFIVGILVYLFFTYNKLNLLHFLLFIVGLFVLIVLLNIIFVKASIKVNEMLNYNTYGKYTLELTPNKFSITVNRKKTDYKYNQISKIVERNKYFIIKLKKSREYLTFEKNSFSEDDYNKMINMFKEKSQNS